MSNANTELETGTTQMNTTLETGKDLNVRTLEMEKNELSTGMKNTMTGMKDAVNSGAPLVQSEMQIAMNNTVQAAKTVLGESGGRSQVFYTLGNNLMTSMASGITAKGSAVSKAMQEVLQRAIDNLDLSSLSKKIDQALGAKMTK
jgi:hypothetical protein